MTEQEFLKDFFEVAKLNLIGDSFSLETALEVFAVREQMRNQLKEDKEKNWETSRQLGYNAGLEKGASEVKDNAESIEDFKDFTIRELITMFEDRKHSSY